MSWTVHGPGSKALYAMKTLSPGKHAVAARRQQSFSCICARQPRRLYSTAVQPPGSRTGAASIRKSQNISEILAKPTWSARSLLPDNSTSSKEEISSKQLHHLLRLSALPLPKSPEEEKQMIDILQSQLHFVRDIQAVNTVSLSPLRSIRDETEGGLREGTIGVEQVSVALSEETIFGHSRRPRRQKKSENVDAGGWDVLGTASRKAGKYFVVKSGKD